MSRVQIINLMHTAASKGDWQLYKKLKTILNTLDLTPKTRASKKH
jgi:hypothetical protein